MLQYLYTQLRKIWSLCCTTGNVNMLQGKNVICKCWRNTRAMCHTAAVSLPAPSVSSVRLGKMRLRLWLLLWVVVLRSNLQHPQFSCHLQKTFQYQHVL